MRSSEQRSGWHTRDTFVRIGHRKKLESIIIQHPAPPHSVNEAIQFTLFILLQYFLIVSDKQMVQKMVEITNENQIKNAPTSVLLSTANDIVSDLVKDSTFFDDAKLQAVTRFQHKEVQTGRIIGRGGFCTVKEIVSIRSAKEKRGKMMWASRRKSGGSRMNVTSPKKQKHQERLDMSYNGVEMSVKEYMTYSANRGGKTRYVVKAVAEEWVYQNRLTYLKGTVDLALEAKYLSTLAHPHIIELRGLSQNGPFNEGFFLVLDRLNDTLPTQLKKWMTIDRQCKGITGAFTGGKKKITALFVDRMKAAYGIANALSYLHSMNLVYRDLVSHVVSGHVPQLLQLSLASCA